MIKKKMPATFNAVEYETEKILKHLQSLDEKVQMLYSISEKLGKLEDFQTGFEEIKGQLQIINNIQSGVEEIKYQLQMLNDLQSNLAEIRCQLQVLGTISQEIQTENYSLESIKVQLPKLDEIQKINKEMSNALEKTMYYCPHEVLAIKRGGFYEIRERADYIEKYQALIKGLDDESIRTINQILSRHLLVHGRENEALDLFSEEERKAIEYWHQSFYAEMPEIVPGIFACGRYLLATPHPGMGYLETTVFKDYAGFVRVHFPEKIKNKDVLDLGAFIGDTALVLSQFTDKVVYAFEPGSKNFEALEKTININHCTNIVGVHAAIGSHSYISYINNEFGMGLTLDMSIEGNLNNLETKEAVSVVSIDEFVAEHGLDIGLIKVDIEGFEQEFLKGAQKTICEQKPILLLSIYHTADDFYGIKPLLESWGLGYHFQVYKGINEHIHYDTMLIAEVY